MAQWSEVVTAMGVAWLAKVRTRRPYAAWRHTATPLPLPDRPEKAGSAKRKRSGSSNRPHMLKIDEIWRRSTPRARPRLLRLERMRVSGLAPTRMYDYGAEDGGGSVGSGGMSFATGRDGELPLPP